MGKQEQSSKPPKHKFYFILNTKSADTGILKVNFGPRKLVQK